MNEEPLVMQDINPNKDKERRILNLVRNLIRYAEI